MLGYGPQVLGFWVRFRLAAIQCLRIDNGAGPSGFTEQSSAVGIIVTYLGECPMTR